MPRSRKPGKTELHLMERLRSAGRLSVERHSGRGPDGGRVAEGDREMNAALKLEQKGVIERISYVRSAHPERGYTAFVTLIRFKPKEQSQVIAK